MRLAASTRFIFACVACALITLSATSTRALIAWTDYQTMPDSQRTSVDAAVVSMLSSVSKSEGFKNKRVHFCARESEIWETSINASCASTFQSANRFAWPIAMTVEGVNFGWIAYVRFASAFCERDEKAEVCKQLELSKARSKSAILILIDRLMSVSYATSGDTALVPTVSEQAVCKVTDDMMLLKNGKKLFLDFSVQPAQQHASLLHSTAAMAASDKETDVAVQDNLRQLGVMGSVIVKNYETKKTWVLDKIKREQVTWIGTEQTTTELGPRGAAGFSSDYDALNRQLVSRKATKTLAEAAMISGACPSASACLWLKDKSVRKQVTLVPLETDEGKQKTLSLTKDASRMIKELEDLVRDDKISKDDLGLIKREHKNMVLAETNGDAKEREALRRRYGQPEVSKAIVGLFDNSVALKKSIADRQRKIVETAFAQNSNGILALGITQKASMVPLLEALCTNPNPEPETTKPAAGKRKIPVKR